eukprot:365142-Chlamydomonas_euryale.AAC.9
MTPRRRTVRLCAPHEKPWPCAAHQHSNRCLARLPSPRALPGLAPLPASGLHSDNQPSIWPEARRATWRLA